MAVAPIEYPPPVDSSKEYIAAPTDPEDERIEVTLDTHKAQRA